MDPKVGEYWFYIPYPYASIEARCEKIVGINKENVVFQSDGCPYDFIHVECCKLVSKYNPPIIVKSERKSWWKFW